MCTHALCPQVLDDGSEHQHRFSFSADVSIVDHVKRYMQEECAKDNLEVCVCVSGVCVCRA